MSNLTRRSVLLGGLVMLASDASAAATRRSRVRTRRTRKRRQRHEQPPDHDAILADLAGRMWFGVRDEGKSLAELEAMLSRGEHPEVLCSNHSLLALRALRKAGVAARQVGAFRRPYVPGPDDGHVMTEVRVGDAWHCYDVMGNTQAVDVAGHGLSVADWCAADEHRWRRIATDPTWPQEGDLAAMYERVLGTPWMRFPTSR